MRCTLALAWLMLLRCVGWQGAPACAQGRQPLAPIQHILPHSSFRLAQQAGDAPPSTPPSTAPLPTPMDPALYPLLESPLDPLTVPGGSSRATLSSDGPPLDTTGNELPPQTPPVEDLPPADALLGPPQHRAQGGPKIPAYDPWSGSPPLESPVDLMFQHMEQHLGRTRERESDQFKALLERVGQIQETFQRQQQMLDLQRELQMAREHAAQTRGAMQQGEGGASAADEPTDPLPNDQLPNDQLPNGPAWPRPGASDDPLDETRDAADPTLTDDGPRTADAVADAESPVNVATPPGDAFDADASASAEPGDSAAGNELPLPENAVSLTNSAVDRTGLADNLFAAGKYDLARQIYEKLLAENPSLEEQMWMRYQLGTCYRALGDFQNARKQFLVVSGTKGVETYSAMASWWLAHLGETQAIQGRWQSVRQGVSEVEAEKTP